MKRTALWLAAGVAGAGICAMLAQAAPARLEGVSGAWTITPTTWKQAAEQRPLVQLTLQMGSAGGRSHWNSSSTVPLPDLRGLTRQQMDAAASDVSFQLVRDAGTLAMEGRFSGGTGAGHFTFTPSAEYLDALAGRGYRDLDSETVFSLALHDVSRAFIRDLAALGYEHVSLDNLVAMRIHGASPEFVRELKALGYGGGVDELIAFRIHGVSPEFVRALKEAGYDSMDGDQLVAFRIHGVSPELVRGLRALGYERPRGDDLVSLCIHGVSLDFVRELKSLGYDPLPSLDDLVSMRIHGVSTDFIRRVNDRSGRRVSVDQLVSMRIHGQDR